MLLAVWLAQSLFSIGDLQVHAAGDPPQNTDIYISFDSNFYDLNNGTVASKQASFTPNKIYANGSYVTLSGSTLNFSDLGYDTSLIQSATLTTDDKTISKTCSSTSCTIGTINGILQGVETSKKDMPEGYFDWWRNMGGAYHPYWWSYDHANGRTYYAGEDEDENGVIVKHYDPWGDCGSSKCEYPGSYQPTFPWDANMSTYPFKATLSDHSTIVVGWEYVINPQAVISKSGDQIAPATDINVNTATGVVKWNHKIGPFDGSGLVKVIQDDANGTRGLKWDYSNSILVAAQTYILPKLWKLSFVTKTCTTDPSMPQCAKPDLVPIAATIDDSCIVVGKAVTIKYGVRNDGASANSTFQIILKVDGVEIHSDSINGLSSGGRQDKTFSYTFSNTAPKDISVNIVADNVAGGALTRTFTAQSSCDPGGGGNQPSGGKLTGKLKVDKPAIDWKQSNLVTATIDTPPNSCAPDTAKFYFKQGSINFETNWMTPVTSTSDFYIFAYGSSGYPGSIQDGMVTVSYTIKDTCGDYSLIDPVTFIINPKPPINPPLLEISWFAATSQQQTTSAILGDSVFVKVIKMTSDPDGGTATLLWDFTDTTTTAWVRSLPNKYSYTVPFNKQQYGNMTADTQGYHKICATATNLGGSSRACAYLDVVGPEPIPVITGGDMVKEGKKLTPALSGENSYSPVPGRTIDHSRDEWTNKQDVYYTPGEVMVTLSVFDNTGLKSLFADTHKITVYPDIPPVPELEYSTPITRATKYFRNTSYSPDGDNMAVYRTTWGYSEWNNGSCDPTTNLISNDNNYFAFQPPRVGTYCFRAYGKEDGLGKDAFRDYTIEVINDNPDVTFTAKGVASEPFPMNIVTYSPSQLAAWTNTSLDKTSIPNNWSVTTDGSLVSGRRIPNGFRPYSMPTNEPTLKGSLKCNPSTSTCYPTSYLGNDRFISIQEGPSTTTVLLTSLNDVPVQIGSYNGYSYGSNVRVVKRKNTDELVLIVQTQSGSASYSNNSQNWYRYKISDLSNGIVSLKASGSFYEYSVSSGSGYNQTGTPPQYADGASISTYAGLNFDQDYKEINLTTRTIKSYKFDNLSTPYKTETYTDIPAQSKASISGFCHTAYTCVSGKPLVDKFLNTTIMDPAGNYVYQLEDGRTVKFDHLTGMPSYFTNKNYLLNTPNTSANVMQSVDGKYLFVTIIYQDDDGNTQTSATTVDLVDGTTYNYNVYPTTGWPYYFPSASNNAVVAVGNSGWALASYGAVDPSDITTKYYSFANYNHENSIRWYGILDDGLFANAYDYKIYSFTPDTGQPPVSNEYVTFGQLFNPTSQQVTNGTVTWTAKYHHFDYIGMTAGGAFRVRDSKNMYRVEADKKTLNLVKIVNGRKTVLGSVSRNMPNEKWVSYSVKLSGDHIKVYEDNGLAIDIYDGTFSNGTMGVYSTADNTEFKGISYMWSEADLLTDTPGVAIVNTDVSYETTYTDPEQDPRLDSGTQWHYTHVDSSMFLNWNDGLSDTSVHQNQTTQTPILIFDKVGLYKIDYRVPDDPQPDHRIAYGDYTFAGYSKYSDWYSQNIIVHRIPIADTESTINANGTVSWTNKSYDPDHCYSPSSCQANYATNHGIFKEKWYYISPSGNMVQAKLIHPTESGTYQVALAVADEYNAWSTWFETSITIDIPVAPDNPPSVLLTFPNGTPSAPSPVSLQPTVTWDQSDPDPGTIYTVFNLTIKDQWGNCTECITNRVMNTANSSWAWTMDNTLSMGGLYQVQVQVSDGELWSPWSNVGWMITNRPPVAYMSFPYGTLGNPTIVNTTRPTALWSQTDPDPGTTYTYFRLQIADISNNVILDTGNVWQGTTSNTGSWAVNTDLPTNQPLRFRVIVTDGYAWSDWSPDAWLLINRPPSVVLTWPTGTQASPDIITTPRPTITWTQTDPDPGAVINYYQVQVIDEENNVIMDSGKTWIGTSATTGSWSPSTDLPAGKKLKVHVKVWDQYDSASEWSNEQWLYINRPPVSDFTWNPTVIWEGDTVNLINLSSDPDGDELSYLWEITGPNTYSSSQTTKDATILGADTENRPGTYTITLTVTDPYGMSNSATKTLVVGALSITGQVNHTAQWELNRQAYNAANPGSQRSLSTFFKGEHFDLVGIPTDTGASTTVANTVTVVAQGIGTADLTKNSAVNFTGQIGTNNALVDLETLADGPYNFTFTVTYSNGVKKTTTVTINILGNWGEYYRLHRIS